MKKTVIVAIIASATSAAADDSAIARHVKQENLARVIETVKRPISTTVARAGSALELPDPAAPARHLENDTRIQNALSECIKHERQETDPGIFTPIDEFYRTALGKRIDTARRTEPPESMIRRMTNKGRAVVTSPGRQALLKALQASQGEYANFGEWVITNLRTLLSASENVCPGALQSIDEEKEQAMLAIASDVEQDEITILMYKFRKFTDSELRKYVQFTESDEYSGYRTVINNIRDCALATIAKEAGTAFGEEARRQKPEICRAAEGSDTGANELSIMYSDRKESWQ